MCVKQHCNRHGRLKLSRLNQRLSLAFGVLLRDSLFKYKSLLKHKLESAPTYIKSSSTFKHFVVKGPGDRVPMGLITYGGQSRQSNQVTHRRQWNSQAAHCLFEEGFIFVHWGHLSLNYDLKNKKNSLTFIISFLWCSTPLTGPVWVAGSG